MYMLDLNINIIYLYLYILFVASIVAELLKQYLPREISFLFVMIQNSIESKNSNPIKNICNLKKYQFKVI